ncbi:MAG: hypothetical protein ACLPUO_25370 [Streptosporangiaceae bacterium]
MGSLVNHEDSERRLAAVPADVEGHIQARCQVRLRRAGALVGLRGEDDRDAVDVVLAGRNRRQRGEELADADAWIEAD